MSTHIPEPWLASQANEQIAGLIEEKRKLNDEYEAKSEILDGRYRDLVSKCEHLIVGVDQSDDENHVCLVCGAYSMRVDDDGREMLTDVENTSNRMILPVMSEVFSKNARYDIDCGAISWRIP